MTDHLLVLSDFHLALASKGKGVWMRFRQPRYFPDEPFAALVERFVQLVGSEPVEVVFNGDTFELDGADAYAGDSGCPDRDRGGPENEARSLERILADHPTFVAALGRLLARAERVVFVAGNHDTSLYWPEVQRVLRARLVRAARQSGSGIEEGELGRRICFRQWFHRTEEGIYIEHGHQYDGSSALPDPLVPSRADGAGLWLSMGSAGYRYIMSGIGTMNPHVPGSFKLGGAREYAQHFFRYYWGNGRSLLGSWLRGSWAAARHVLGQRPGISDPSPVETRREQLAQARRYGLAQARLRELCRLHARPMSRSPYAVLRELWLDRVAIVGLGLLAAVVTAVLAPWPAVFAVLLTTVTALLAYERLAPQDDYRDYEAVLDELPRQIARLAGAQVVVLGHTHRARQARQPGLRVFDTGHWCAAYRDAECTVLEHPARTFLWARSENGVVQGAELLEWRDGAMRPFTNDLLVAGTREALPLVDAPRLADSG